MRNELEYTLNHMLYKNKANARIRQVPWRDATWHGLIVPPNGTIGMRFICANNKQSIFTQLIVDERGAWHYRGYFCKCMRPNQHQHCSSMHSRHVIVLDRERCESAYAIYDFMSSLLHWKCMLIHLYFSLPLLCFREHIRCSSCTTPPTSYQECASYQT